MATYYHTLTYDANGGSNPPTSQSISNESPNSFEVTLSNSRPTRSGYNFIGWTTTKFPILETIPTHFPGRAYTFEKSDIVLYAVWSRFHIHLITYNPNGGTDFPLLDRLKMEFNSSENTFTHTIVKAQPKKTGFTFAGWAETRNAKLPQYFSDETYSFNKDNITLYAVWTAKRNVTVTITAGKGSVYINEQLTSGTRVMNYNDDIVYAITPTNNPQEGYYYIKSVKFNTQEVLPAHTVGVFTNEGNPFLLLEDATIEVEFAERPEYELTVEEGDYTVDGVGTYKYLQKVVVLAELKDKSMIFNNWYKIEDGKEVIVSNKNPAVITIPNHNIKLYIKLGSDFFGNLEVRQFAIQNRDNEVIKLTDYDSKIFLADPEGFGISKEIESERYGYVDIIKNKKCNTPEPKGNLIFFDDVNGLIYDDYYDFTRFISKEPLTLWQKLPISKENNTFGLPVEILELGKEQTNEDGYMSAPISFKGTTFWKLTESSANETKTSVKIYNDSDVEVGIMVSVSIANGSAFNNPVIKFKQTIVDSDGRAKDVEFGAIAINRSLVTKVILDTRDTKNTLRLFEGEDTEIANSFKYIDFSYVRKYSDESDNQFPFPRLKQGYNIIEFNYEGESQSSEDKIYDIEFEKVYLSV